MTASNFPHAIDLDAQLLRRTATDAIVPADHNNLVDAIQQLEAVLGTAADGTQPSGSPAFVTGLLDLLGFPGTAMGNPRYPFIPLPAGAWYARPGITPASWTLGAGTSVAYDRPRGLARLSWATASPYLVASSPVVGSAPWSIVFQSRLSGPAAGALRRVAIGFSLTGLGADLDGVVLIAGGPGQMSYVQIAGGVYDDQDPPAVVPVPAGRVWLYHDGANVLCSASADGAVWHPLGSGAVATGVPTAVVLYAVADGDGPDDYILDYIVQGNAPAPNV
jgi:hypothetical protein